MVVRITVFGILCWITPFFASGQTYSPDVVSIEGLKFSRFVLSVKTLANFSAHSKATSWLYVLEKNLCWSGVFKLFESANNFCRVTGERLDLQLHVGIKETGRPAVILTVADSEGIALFEEMIPLVQNRLRETDVMDVINQITEKLTVQPGILGSTIAFSFKQPGYRSVIARINTHGQHLAAVSHNRFISIIPEWNPDGTSIVYTVVSRSGTSVYHDDLRGNTRLLVKREGVNTGGTWTKNGNALIFSYSRNGNADLYMYHLETQKLTRLTTHPRIDTSPSLSPDGKNLLFVSDRAGSPQIYNMRLPGREVRRVTFTDSRNTDPVWSPDGSLIAFTKFTRGRDQIYLMDSAGENVRPLIQSPYPCEQPAWSPDNRQIVFSSKRGKDFKLYTVFLDGKGLRRLTQTPEGYHEKSPSWTLRRIDF